MVTRRMLTILCIISLFAGTPVLAETHLRISAQALDADAPVALVGAGATRDTRRNRVIVFGTNRRRSPSGQFESFTLGFDLGTNKWSRIETTGPGPTGSGHPGLTYVSGEDALYLFGGWTPGASNPTAELWRLELSGGGPRHWEQLPQQGDWPPARNGMVFVADEPRGVLLVHGGDGGPRPKYGFTPLDDLWSFDLKKRTWTRIDATGDAPKPRWNHTSAIDPLGGKLYVFGGAGYVLSPKPAQVADAEIHVFDLTSHEWSTMPKQKHMPRPVEGTSMTLDPDAHALVVVGGLALATKENPGTQRVYCFDLVRKKWIRSKPVLKNKRRDHVGIYDPIGHRQVIFGGQRVVESGNFYAAGQPLADVASVTVERKSRPD